MSPKSIAYICGCTHKQSSVILTQVIYFDVVQYA